MTSLRLAVLLSTALICAAAHGQTPQSHVQHHGHEVMPFDLARVVHIFRMTEQGGVQRVTAKEPTDREQVALIQEHLQHEAANFAAGNFNDPAHLHGAGMPGLKELQSGVGQVAVVYSPLPDGAQISFTTSDLHLLTAIHRWFGAQLSEHGADARAE